MAAAVMMWTAIASLMVNETPGGMWSEPLALYSIVVDSLDKALGGTLSVLRRYASCGLMTSELPVYDNALSSHPSTSKNTGGLDYARRRSEESGSFSPLISYVLCRI
jgi:hypothetical protein